MTEGDALRAARDKLARTSAQIAAADETTASFTWENNQPLVANGGVGLLRAEIDQRLETA